MNVELAQSHLAAAAQIRGQRRQIEIEGKSVTFWFYPASKPTKDSIVLIHGYRGNHHGLEAIAGALVEFDLYIPDLPGFGESQAFQGNHGIEEYANWLNFFISQLGLRSKPHLVGHSFGSIVVSAYASRFDGIGSLILENPVASPALGGPRALVSVATNAFFALAKFVPDSFGTWLLKSWPMVRGMSVVMTKSRERYLRKWIHAQHDANFSDFANRRVALEGYAASVSNCVSDFSAKFSVPVLMLIGERDDITSPKQQRELFDSLEVSICQLVEFSSVGHLTHYEIPELIAEAISQWVNEIND